MKEDKCELPAPPAVELANKAMEIIRVWIVDNHQEIVLSPHLWNDPGTWGLLLVDIAKHVANVYGEKGLDRDSVLKSIKEALDAEWAQPTD